MHLYIWLLVLASQSRIIVFRWLRINRGIPRRNICIVISSMQYLLTHFTDLPPHCSPSEDESWPGPQARRPYLGPEETSAPPLAPPVVAPKKPQYQPVTNNYSTGVGMVSRRAIISRSRDDLQHHLGVNNKNFTGEDQWFSKEKLYKVCSSALA